MTSTELQNVEWRDIPGYYGYQASNDGRVRSVDRTITDTLGRARRLKGRILAQFTDRNGYFRVGISAGEALATGQALVHRLVCMAFNGLPQDGRECAHRDGNNQNNTPENLYWATPSENVQDTIRHGRNRNLNKTHCPAGHEYTPENTAIQKTGRACRTCQNKRNRIYREENREKVRAASLASYHRRKSA